MNSLIKTKSLHSCIVLVSKHVLLAFTALLVLAVIIVAWLNQSTSNGRLVIDNTQKTAGAAKSVMSKPKYQGIDSKNKPFTIIADTATDEGDKTYSLVNIMAELAPNSKNSSRLKSKSAKYYSAKEQIELFDGVELSNNEGYVFNTSKASVDTKNSHVIGTDPVTGAGPAGTLSANRFEIKEGGDRIFFYENVHVTIFEKEKGTQIQ